MHDVPSDNVVIPWQRVAFAFGLVAVAALATLVVVTAVKQSDLLSTVALALAILAFAAQLAIAIVQSQAAVEQRGRLEQINGDTRALLADIRATTSGVLTTVQTHFETVLRHALGEAIPEAVGESVEGGGKLDPAEFERSVLRKLEEIFEDRTPAATFSMSPPPPTTGAELLGLRPGDWVMHRKWGRGHVQEVRGEGEDSEATVHFQNVGDKRLLLKWTPLRRIKPPASKAPSDDDPVT